MDHPPIPVLQLRLANATDTQPLLISDPQIHEILILLTQDLKQQNQLSVYSTKLNISIRQFERRFKTETGLTFSMYVKKTRMEKASKLLATTHFSIKEISQEIGWNDYSHFVADFRKMYGWTPLAYRKRFYGAWRDVGIGI